MKTYGYVLNVLSDLEVWEKIFEMSLKGEILQEARERFGASGYGQDELLDLAFEMIGKRLDKKIKKIRSDERKDEKRIETGKHMHVDDMNFYLYRRESLEEFKEEMLK